MRWLRLPGLSVRLPVRAAPVPTLTTDYRLTTHRKQDARLEGRRKDRAFAKELLEDVAPKQTGRDKLVGPWAGSAWKLSIQPTWLRRRVLLPSVAVAEPDHGTSMLWALRAPPRRV